MPIVFSDHAKDQLRKRGITQKLAIETIKNSRKVIVSFKNRKLRQKEVSGKILEIVTKTEGNKITVITGYFLKK